ncbi:PREDICTED: FXYD domain-containing ion transport regulator 5-like [Elephantulus edwardii]|uniref:FXYD domain-containing ion transport regulator 5-like n=1 Tax=Elephantulus edwardii TaxID=28737 RepID=UPI0003F098C3|nr:PREDICTED: FXYD domain-containing ion transport regulator 5-like [Elephantulus edwardii]
MSPSGHLFLLSIISLVLPTRGLMLETTSIPGTELNSVERHVQTQVPDTVRPEDQSTPQTSTAKTRKTTENKITIQSQSPAQPQQPMGKDMSLMRDVEIDRRGMKDPTEDTTLSERQSLDKDIRTDAHAPQKAGTDEAVNNLFFYDEDTLWKQGLLVAAVLFITGIVILTSGKCRQLPQLCRNSYR